MLDTMLQQIEKLKGVRTTACFVLVTLCTFISLWTGTMGAALAVGLTKWTFGLYVGAKATYKGVEVMQAKVNGKK